MSDEEITLEPSDSKYRDSVSQEVSLGTALNGYQCPDCGHRVMWVLDPEPDSLCYYSDSVCDCGYRYYIKPTKVRVESRTVDE